MHENPKRLQKQHGYKPKHILNNILSINKSISFKTSRITNLFNTLYQTHNENIIQKHNTITNTITINIK